MAATLLLLLISHQFFVLLIELFLQLISNKFLHLLSPFGQLAIINFLKYFLVLINISCKLGILFLPENIKVLSLHPFNLSFVLFEPIVYLLIQVSVILVGDLKKLSQLSIFNHQSI